MTEEQDGNKQLDADGASQEADDIFSLEDLDKILEDEDPQFAKEMDEIKSDEELATADVEVISLGDDAPDIEEEEESKPSFLVRHPKFGRRVAPLLALITNVNRKIKGAMGEVVHKVVYWSTESVQWLKNDLPTAIKTGKERALFYKSKFQERKTHYKKLYSDLSRNKKVSLYISIILVFFVVFLIQQTLDEGWLPAINKPLITSLEEKGTDVIEFDPQKDLVKFYDAFPQPEFFVLLDPITVSLKRKRLSETPMANAEFYLEVDSQETAIEIDDRMTQMIDVTQRALESFTYEDIQGAAGKAKLSALVRYELNKVLTQGRVLRVVTKRFITKP